ncbi:MAG: hypothetical protein LUH15_15975 [Tannerellaceae bacterium]|nr:hypothetical protein [Tannerellaceae bacterium]
MSKSKKKDFFWLSYSDLMTSLFFVMFVLFVVVIIKMQLTNKVLGDTLEQANVTIEEQTRLLQLDKQFDPLVASDKFKYFPESRKFVAKDFLGVEIFDSNQVMILPEYREKTIEAGKAIEDLLRTLSEENAEFTYLLVLEGNAANTFDARFSQDDNYGYTLSYGRALAVYQLWRSAGIDLRKYNTELLISGSGFNGLDRDEIEENNKRFSIQIIPKIRSPKN